MSVRVLHRHLRDGVFAVPRLQREFVWNGRKAAALLDSIYRQMPIGTLMIWKTKKENQHLLRKNLHVLPPFQETNGSIWYLIDGQQRLSVLHQVATGSTQANGNGQEIDFSRICFRVTSPIDGERDNTAFHYRRAVEGEFISLRDILQTSWRRRFRDLPKYKMKKLESCRNTVMNYQVPIVFVETHDLDEVRDLFIRINSLGTPIASADRAFARASAVDLREMAHETRELLPPEFRKLPFETVLQAFAFVAESKSTEVGERAYEAAIRRWEKKIEKNDGERESLKRVWNGLNAAVGKAVDYLRNTFCVLNESFLPSDNMVATLAVFFYHHPRQPSAKQRREIAKWFWATGVSQRYSGRGFRANVQRDVEYFRRLANRKPSGFVVGELADRDDVRRADYSRRSSLTSAFYCLLARRQPMYITNGEPIPQHEVSARANRKNRHHIFPRKLLANHQISYRQYNSICNICLLTAAENVSFGARQPRMYLKEFVVKKHFARAMRSHSIPHDAKSALWRQKVPVAFAAFVRQRREMLCRAFEEQAGTRLFKRK